MGIHQNSGPPWSEIRENQLIPILPEFFWGVDKSQLIRPNLLLSRIQYFRQSLNDWLILILFYLFPYK